MKKINLVILALLVAAGLVLGVITMRAPASSAVSRFNVQNMIDDDKVLSQDIHSVAAQDALAANRAYLVQRLADLGMNPQILTYPDVQSVYINETIPINDIYAATPGNFSSYILLVAHYDSSPGHRSAEDSGSHGAADDAYGCTAILELSRLIMEDARQAALVNGIKVLFTDDEETNMAGSEDAARDPKVMENVSCVLNLEARGVRGPVVMFETSKNNAALINLYAKAKNPYTYSLATAVYRVMPNDTDFTNFTAQGYSGLNFANLETLYYYHNHNDNFSNINADTMRQYGDNIYPMLREFTTNIAYSDVNWAKAGSDSTAFSILPGGVMIVYSSAVGMILLAAMLLAVALMLFFAAQKKLLKQTLLWAAKWLGAALGAAALGVLVSFIVSWVSGIPFKITYIPNVSYAGVLIIVTVVLVALIMSFLAFRSARKGGDPAAMLAGGVALQAALTLVFTFVLPGGAFLFLFPAIIFALSAILLLRSKFGRVPAALGIFYTVLLFTPLLMLFNIALTVGALCVILLLSALAMAAAVPAGLAVLRKTK
ncbi:MAG: M28 family peptidase [Firmicutes bacterium]|nr:M28 family peptidase [Bacillota bacterium]